MCLDLQNTLTLISKDVKNLKQNMFQEMTYTLPHYINLTLNLVNHVDI